MSSDPLTATFWPKYVDFSTFFDVFSAFFSKPSQKCTIEDTFTNFRFLPKCTFSRRKIIKNAFWHPITNRRLFDHFSLPFWWFFQFFQLRRIKNSRTRIARSKTFFYYFSTHKVVSVDHNNRDLGSAIVDRNSMIFAGKLKIPKNSILRPKKVLKTSRYKGGWQKILFYYFSLCNFTPFQKFVGKTSKLGACCMRKTLIQGRFCTVPLTPWYKAKSATGRKIEKYVYIR